MTTHTYRIKTTFKNALYFHDYPLDKQILALQFRHNHFTRDQLIYVVDVLGMGDTSIEGKTPSFFSVSGWKINKISSFQNSQKNESTLGIPELFDTQQRVEYSQFNILIDIERHVLNFIFKNLLPIIFVIALGYVVYFTTSFDMQISININMIIATSLFHLQLASSLSAIDYNVLIEYVFYTVYMMAILGIIGSIIMHRQAIKVEELKETMCEMKKAKDGKAEAIKKAEENISQINRFINRINWTGRIGYPLLIAAIMVAISYDKW
ncbi:MAG: hypothetical protein DRR19_11660 [Candidatus Parabeggiatoa sp. nov. 1]|nr:MAG: hypothetical protein DRR19_11660 [Gammaproteobacteria bacterium]